MARPAPTPHASHPKIDEKKELTQALNLLQQAGLRRTKSREALLGFLIREHGPFTIEEIFRGIKKKDLDVVTVYRGVLSLEKIGLARRCDFGDSVARYEFQSDPRYHHHHVICKTCRKMESLESCRLPDLEVQAKQLGYSDLTHSLEFFGVCKGCKMNSLHAT
jgi:Fur family transcriptional regulator, ferric uptake regulator